MTILWNCCCNNNSICFIQNSIYSRISAICSIPFIGGTIGCKLPVIILDLVSTRKNLIFMGKADWYINPG